MGELSADDSLRCVVLRGAGDKAFSAGADISEFDTVRRSAAAAKEYGALVARALDALSGCRHPTVAMIRGACVGGGLEIATYCDLRIAGESSRFGIPISRLGLVVARDEMARLVELVGRAHALEILLEGRVFGAGEALAKGLLNRVVPDDQVEKEVSESAERIARGAPLVARWHKKFAARLRDPRPLTPEEADEEYACYETEDFRIGTRAFLDKKTPEFKGR
jgi:enoyl-CoA hydratase/carnithine racemase